MCSRRTVLLKNICSVNSPFVFVFVAQPFPAQAPTNTTCLRAFDPSQLRRVDLPAQLGCPTNPLIPAAAAAAAAPAPATSAAATTVGAAFVAAAATVAAAVLGLFVAASRCCGQPSGSLLSGFCAQIIDIRVKQLQEKYPENLYFDSSFFGFLCPTTDKVRGSIFFFLWLVGWRCRGCGYCGCCYSFCCYCAPAAASSAAAVAVAASTTVWAAVAVTSAAGVVVAVAVAAFFCFVVGRRDR